MPPTSHSSSRPPKSPQIPQCPNFPQCPGTPCGVFLLATEPPIVLPTSNRVPWFPPALADTLQSTTVPLKTFPETPSLTGAPAPFRIPAEYPNLPITPQWHSTLYRAFQHFNTYIVFPYFYCFNINFFILYCWGMEDFGRLYRNLVSIKLATATLQHSQ